MIDPCDSEPGLMQVVLTGLNVIQAIGLGFLALKRNQADSERREFEESVRFRLGLMRGRKKRPVPNRHDDH